ncbi:hypothetical protein PNA2_0201 [Pyrococcus sp. NA2]|uniref:stage II sporulation protein M n=1 Tax=Pyrococcus sp. (strain NA2) TaxID=342949 RepID=UPI000209AF4B|nr:stage II sporulation protein M [Pyrococcus sp. NA2]AEC51120.1 hypothetical protein PNA2_0201 [Pyrococcus sp. NA2]
MGRNSKVALALFLTFIFGVAIGGIITKANPSFAEHVYSILRRLLGGGKLPQGFSLFKFIFLNNTRVAIIIAFSGIIFGILPFLVLLFNGVIVGVVTTYAIIRGASVEKVLLSIIPHGIVEIPAFIIAGVGGINWFLEVVRGEGDFGNRLRRGFYIMLKFLGWSILLLFIAALIEAFITPKIAGIH